jgi:ABC-type sugar transport system substrate-binding protein
VKKVKMRKAVLALLVVALLLATTLPAAAAPMPNTACQRYIIIVVNGVPVKLCLTKPPPTAPLWPESGFSG